MQKKTETSLLKNTDAYIPFAVIGIFIVLGATLTSVYFVKMDYEIAQTIYDTDLTNPKQTATNLAAADLSRCLNYAGMEALKWQGEHPIIQPDGALVEQTSVDGFLATISTRDLEPGDTVRVSIDLPRDVWGGIESIWDDQSVILSLYDSSNSIIETIDYGEAVGVWKKVSFDEFINIPDSPSVGYGYIELTCGGKRKATDWFNIGTSPIKDITAEHLNNLIATNYRYNLHTFDQYAINVEPDIKPEQIIIRKVNGTLDREINSTSKVYTIYYTFEINNLNYTLVDLVTNETTNHTTTISSLITSREPLLAELTTEYENELKSGDTQYIVLGAANIRTFSYGPWQHYAKGPLNILTNPALASAINAGTVYTQKKVFDSVDPWALMFTTYYNGKVLYQDVRGEAGSYDAEKSIDLTTTFDKLAADKSFSIDVEGGINDSMAESGTTLTQVSDDSKIIVAASDYTQGVLDGWVFNDRLDRWSGSNDLLHNITNEVYKADVQAQVTRDGFGSIISPDPDISASSGSVSYSGGTVSWSESYAVSGKHTGALVPSYGWSDLETNSYSQTMNPSISKPGYDVTSWRITGASVSLSSVDVTDAKVTPYYTYAGGDNITYVQRTDGYLDWENHIFDWLIRYGVSYNIKTTWSINYDYTYTYKWRTFEGYRDPINKTGPIYSTHYGSSSGSSSTSTSKLDSESLSHTETETEHLTITYHKRPPTSGYLGLDTYSDPTAREYRETIVNVNGVDKLDVGCSDAADKYFVEHVNVYNIESKYSQFPDGEYLLKDTIQCDVPDWLHKTMADEVLDMVDSIDSDDPSVSFSLLDNLGADPTQLRADAANELVVDLEQARAGYVDKSKHQDGLALYTSSDAARFIAKNEAYNKLIADIEDKNEALKGGLNEYVLDKIEENGINISGLTGVTSGSLSLFNNPAIGMAGNALGAEMGIIDTMTITGMPESKYNWTENMTLVIDQYPDYLYHDENFDFRDEYELRDPKGRIVYPLGIKNTCVFTTGIADDIADVLDGGGDSIKTATSQMVSQSISDLNAEVTSLVDNLSEQAVTFDTSVMDANLINLKQVYSSQMKIRIPEKVAEQVAVDPVVSGWIGSDDVTLITSRYLNGLSREDIIVQSSDDTLSSEISSRIKMQIIGSNLSVSDDEMDAVLHRVDTDVRIGVAEGISVVIIDNKDTIDSSFEAINDELQGMLDESVDQLSGEVAERVSKRLEKTMNMVPAGLPVIPPNWVFTINVWTYDVMGKYDKFRVIDNDNEVIFDPYFGHVGQVYVRQDELISYNGEYLGVNLPIEFKFKGYAATIVGPGPKGVGDKIGGRIEESEGYINQLS